MQPKARVGIVIINYNGATMLPHCLDKLADLRYPDQEVILLDNDSSDNSVEVVRDRFPQIKIHQTGHNGGYSGGAEIAVNLAKKNNWDFLLLLNPDLIFESDYLEIIIAKMLANPQIGACIGKLYKYEFFAEEITNIIDSTGIKATRDRRFLDRGQAEVDSGQYDQAEAIFGITGAAPLYRVDALEDIRILGEVFDQDFFMYKEDVDVAWRLQLFGWTCWYEPRAVAHHGRGTGVYKRNSYVDTAMERKKLSRFQKTHSFRNQHLMQFKNELWGNFWHDCLWIIGKEILFLGFILVKEPYLLKSLWQFIRLIPKFKRKRQAIMKRKRIDSEKMQQWFTS